MILAMAFPFAIAGCSSGSGALSYEQINGAEAKALMDKESGYIIIDARRQWAIVKTAALMTRILCFFLSNAY